MNKPQPKENVVKKLKAIYDKRVAGEPFVPVSAEELMKIIK